MTQTHETVELRERIGQMAYEHSHAYGDWPLLLPSVREWWRKLADRILALLEDEPGDEITRLRERVEELEGHKRWGDTGTVVWLKYDDPPQPHTPESGRFDVAQREGWTEALLVPLRAFTDRERDDG